MTENKKVIITKQYTATIYYQKPRFKYIIYGIH